uniref:Uncharacterized protein n=1 Tax=uncultured delta proteobacterium Rifle_16ft_4_minimus_1997 TaxID=1665176 RepID=A0A0H4T1P3_9DELT|nr:hypothetical protein [uncultured delta proteobacterium Rifle_16ft_4_minimus_1997]
MVLEYSMVTSLHKHSGVSYQQSGLSPDFTHQELACFLHKQKARSPTQTKQSV